MPDSKKLSALRKLLLKTMPHFENEKIAECRPNCNETAILVEMALLHAKLGQKNETILLLDGIVKNMDNLRITIDERRSIFPKPHVRLAALLMEAGEYSKAADLCTRAIKLINGDFCNRYYIAEAAYIKGACYHKMNKDKDEYMPFLLMAYHSAMGIRQNALADIIRKEYDIV